jgi:hypothetical protein
MTDTPDPTIREIAERFPAEHAAILRDIDKTLAPINLRAAAQQRVAVAASRVTDAEQAAAPIRAEFEVWRARLAEAEAKVAAARAELAEADAALKAVR